MFNYILFISLVLLIYFANCKDLPKVKTTYGWVQGNYSTTRGGREVMEFLGIKYAQAPTGNLRFKEPKEPQGWTGVKSATEECSSCLQPTPTFDSVTGSEDCLCLNIFTPQTCPDKTMPVVVFIHGGSYILFSSDRSFYGPELLLDKDVVLVTINYRLGVLGFLSTEDEVVPGSWGMKDQVAALRWVRDNIAQFGGNPSSVTLMGESAGAASVHLHMLSPLSRGLFHKGVVHSASSRVPWAVAEPGVLRERTALVAQRVGCPTTQSAALLSCMQSVPPEKVVATTKDFFIWDSDPFIIWNPAIESPSVKGAFLTESPRKLSSHLPLLIGFNFAEGALKTLRVTGGNVQEKFQQWNNDFANLTAMSLLYNRTAANPSSVTAILRTFYFGLVKQITPEMTPQITQLYGDFWFANGILDAVEQHKGPAYLYYFNFNNTAHFSLLSQFLNNPMYLGTAHVDELPYLFSMKGSYKIVDPDLSQKVVEMWTNFIKTSVPSGGGVRWSPVASPSLEFLDISNDGMVMKKCPLKERRRLYKTLKLWRQTALECANNLKSLAEWNLLCHS